MTSSSSFLFFLFFIISISMVLLLVSSHRFEVGGDRGWSKSTGNDSETYFNHWASMNRFHVGDTVYFKYQNDSVLVVKEPDYENCTTSNPISKFEDGNTVFEFDRFGFIYFISGQPGHCKSGQKLIVRVMVHPEAESPQNAPPPDDKAGGGSGSGGGHGGSWSSDVFGPPGFFNSTTKLSVVSHFMTVFVALFIILYLFM
ncbi:hypothetical protein ACSBR1_029040 [Camellia fascicularis]